MPPQGRAPVAPIRQGARQHVIGDTFGELTLVSYSPPDKNGSRGVFLCACGTKKTLRIGNVASGATTNCADRDAHADPRLVDVPVINTAHARIARLRGPASDHPCALCGKVSELSQWSYRHSSTAPLVQDAGRDAGQVYSDDPMHYWSLCRGCHGRFDASHRALGRPKGSLSGEHHALALAYDPYGDD